MDLDDKEMRFAMAASFLIGIFFFLFGFYHTLSIWPYGMRVIVEGGYLMVAGIVLVIFGSYVEYKRKSIVPEEILGFCEGPKDCRPGRKKCAACPKLRRN